MPSKFTWFPKITRVVERIPSEDQRGTFALAVMRYGTEGAEPSLEYPLDALFESIREDVDNSVSAREGNAGGRPRRQRKDAPRDVREAEAEPESAPEVEKQAEKERGLNEGETPVSDIENGGYETSEPLLYKPSQDKPIQTRPEKEGGARARFRAPTPDEVGAFAADAGLSLDAERFCDFYASKGWTVGKAKMRDWKAAARNWARRDAVGKGAGREELGEYAGAF